MRAGRKQVVIIGNGKMAKDCAEILLADFHTMCDLACIVIDAARENIMDLRNYCIRRKIVFVESANINSKEALESIASHSPDILFSINNHQIIREALLATPAEGVINFHNAPLPRYGGLNACTWAIFNGEAEHGVTWHYVSAAVDEGDIIAQRRLALRPDITALQLVMTCISEGVALFKEILPQVIQGKVSRTKQDLSLRLYYYDRMVPEEGKIDFRWNYDRIDRLVRALNYHPLGSKLGAAKAYINGNLFFVDKVKQVNQERNHTPGEVLCAQDYLHIQAADSVVEVSEVRDKDSIRIPLSRLIEAYGIQPNQQVEKYI